MKTTIQEHKSSSYASRTYHNAKTAELTIAIAVYFTTAGEKLTYKASGGNYLPVDYHTTSIVSSRDIWKMCKLLNVKTLNIAGNGIYTLSKQGITQEEVNKRVYEILLPVCTHWPIKKIVSGGQTGVDWAGGVAATALGIDCVMTLPKGFKQRHFDGVDTEQELDELYNRLRLDVCKLLSVY